MLNAIRSDLACDMLYSRASPDRARTTRRVSSTGAPTGRSNHSPTTGSAADVEISSSVSPTADPISSSISWYGERCRLMEVSVTSSPKQDAGRNDVRRLSG